MLIDTSITVAYRYFCGSFEFFNVSMFKLLHNEYSLACRCKKSRITMKRRVKQLFDQDTLYRV